MNNKTKKSKVLDFRSILLNNIALDNDGSKATASEFNKAKT